MSLARSAQDAPEDNRLAPWWPPAPPEPRTVEEPDADRAAAEAVADGVLVLRLSNHPTEENVAAAAAWRPEAEPILRRWKEIWDRSFPTPESRAFQEKHVNEVPGEYYEKWYEGNAKRKADALARGDTASAAVSAFWEENRPKVAHPGQRDWRAHVIDDAEATCAIAEAFPGDAWLSLGDRPIVLAGFFDDGLPRLEYATPTWNRDPMAGVLKRNRPNDDHPYWTSPAFLKHAGRPFRVARQHHEAAIVLLAMAEAGHRKAFLKGVESKSGTWTADLSMVRDASDAAGALYRAVMPWGLPGKGIVVQEHVPFTHEQRFFVVGGRIAASVCSDRRFSAADKGSRILDERIAVLRVPEVDEGTFDRGITVHVVDRLLAAQFARKARVVVRDLAAEGVLDFVLDMGLAADGRGVLPIELNSLYLSGPYCLDATRIVRSRNRLRERAFRTVRARFADVAATAAGCSHVDAEGLGEIVDIAMERLATLSAIVEKLVSGGFEPERRPGGRPERTARIRTDEIVLGIDAALATWRGRRRSVLDPDEAAAIAAPGAGGAVADATFSFLRGKPLFSLPIAAGSDGSEGRLCCSLVDVGGGSRRLGLAVGLAGSDSWRIGLVFEKNLDGTSRPSPDFVRRLRRDADTRCREASSRLNPIALFADAGGNVAWCERSDAPGGMRVVLRRPDGSELRHDVLLDEGVDVRAAVAVRDPSDGSIVWRKGGGYDHEIDVMEFLASLPCDEDDPSSIADGIVDDVPVARSREKAGESDVLPPTVVPSLAPGSGTRAEAAALALLPDGDPVFSIPLEFEAVDRTGIRRTYAMRLCGSQVREDKDYPPTILVAVAGRVDGLWTASVLDFVHDDDGRVSNPWERGDQRLPGGARSGGFDEGAFVLLDVDGVAAATLRWIPDGRRGRVEVVLDRSGSRVGSLVFDPWFLRPDAEEAAPEVAGVGADGEPVEGISLDPSEA